MTLLVWRLLTILESMHDLRTGWRLTGRAKKPYEGMLRCLTVTQHARQSEKGPRLSHAFS